MHNWTCSSISKYSLLFSKQQADVLGFSCPSVPKFTVKTMCNSRVCLSSLVASLEVILDTIQECKGNLPPDFFISNNEVGCMAPTPIYSSSRCTNALFISSCHNFFGARKITVADMMQLFLSDSPFPATEKKILFKLKNTYGMEGLIFTQNRVLDIKIQR